jgi:hypothetical protein
MNRAFAPAEPSLDLVTEIQTIFPQPVPASCGAGEHTRTLLFPELQIKPKHPPEKQSKC